MKSDWIWMDGAFVPYDQATVHILNPTMHYGPGIFEGIRCYPTENGPAVFRLREHMQRFIQSAHILGVDTPYDLETLCSAVRETVTRNRFQGCYIRPLMYFVGTMGLSLVPARAVVAIAAWEWGAYLGQEALETGSRMVVSSFTRMHPNASMTKAKITGQYANSVLAKTMAARMGYDEAILLDSNGYVAEGSGENLFVVRGGSLYTPPGQGVLEGITRDSVIQLAGDLGYPVVETLLSRDQLYTADEVFVCGTAAEVTAVREIDLRKIGIGRMGQVTQAIQSLYFETVHGKGARSERWCDYVAQK